MVTSEERARIAQAVEEIRAAENAVKVAQPAARRMRALIIGNYGRVPRELWRAGQTLKDAQAALDDAWRRHRALLLDHVERSVEKKGRAKRGEETASSAG